LYKSSRELFKRQLLWNDAVFLAIQKTVVETIVDL